MNLNRRHLLYLFPLAGLVFLALLSYAYFVEPQRLVVKHETLQIKGWDPTFDGLKIVMLSDIHGGSNYVTEERLQEIVRKINEQQPDLVVMLGDYVSEIREDDPATRGQLKMPIETIAGNLSGIKSTYGVFAVLGNHDGWYNDGKIATAFTAVGYKVLQNEIASIEKDSKKLRILGMKDHLKLTKGWKATSDELKQIAASSGEGQIIALEHSPDLMPVITGPLSISDDLKLVLAAHTHGGQVWIPIFGRPVVPSTFGQKYAHGHIRENNVDLFVTSGIGMSVLPIRFLVPPEIVVLRITSAPLG
jgi:predicted MPP superfamily phosphohydrolase